MAVGLGAAVAAAMVFGVAAILQAIASRRVPTVSGPRPRQLLRMVVQLCRQPAFAAAVALDLAGFGLHLVALRALPLYLAQAGIAASLAVTALLAVRVVGDRLHGVEWAAVAAVCVGLAALGAAAGDAGERRATRGLTAWLIAAVLAIALAGLFASRSTRTVATAVLGLLAGCGFAAAAVAARLLPDLAPGAVLTTPAAYLVMVSGSFAFLLYSLALQRGSVTVATAAMIVTQTMVPAALGVLLLGDAVRQGWTAIAGIGLAITAAGAVVLVRFERVRELA